jgi:serine protease Do
MDTSERPNNTENIIPEPVPTPPVHHHPDSRKIKVLAFAMLFILSISSGFFGAWLFARDDTQSTQKQQVVLKSQAQLISSIAKNVGQSVVSVEVTTSSQLNGGLFGFSNLQETESQSAGTGIILDDKGLIITNRHVVPAGTKNVSVVLSDGTRYDNVEVIGRTNSSDTLDVAFLQIKDTQGRTLVPAEIGDSSKVSIGDSVVAIGNALGQFQNTVTSGIISGHGRSVEAANESGSESESLTDLFQTDAAINQGNSGGPLVNLEGQVIGINTAVADSAQNIGFAIPMNDVTGLIKSIKETGTLQRPYLGVVYVSVTDAIAKEYNLSVKRGAYIPPQSVLGQDTIANGSPAEKAGLKEKDIITKIDGTAIEENKSLTSLLGKHAVGDTVQLTVQRDGKQITVPVTIGNAPSED